ncbi:uncharacterized protein LOC110816662 isoform X2 [Carica papaya]|uniref:uncharacterized protein LOC110816662 isoform X2 n=1 Tax=Carica papaya TaxID=3649 RepID=UPI000B8D1847|nr:uncharacterized protein LOC110816662 isoform X2 [Carica papaya]
MSGVNGRSSSSSYASPSQHNSPRVLDTGLLQNIFSSSPRLSSSRANPINCTPIICSSTLDLIVQLERRLQDQDSLYWDSKNAVGCSSAKSTPSNAPQRQKSSADLRQEIAMLEDEIVRLEHYLLSLYRSAFQERMPSFSNVTGSQLSFETSSPASVMANQVCCDLEPCRKKGGFDCHVQSSPAYDTVLLDGQSFCAGLKKTSSGGRERTDSGHRILADYLGASHMLSDLSTPDRISEEIVRCISSIYCKLSNTSQSNAGIPTSPISSFSSSSIFSSNNPCDSWSPLCSEDATMNLRFKELKEVNRPPAANIEVLKICIDNDNFNYAATMLQNFRSLIRNLELVDPRKMKREEKLAFWINIHNALVMHAHLAYGTRNRSKSNSILKAAYHVGGHSVNAYVIRCSILGIRPNNPAPWVQSLFNPGRKFKIGSTRHAFALEYPEPLVHFALCSGAYFDPAVRVYTAKTIFQDLRRAKEEFIQANMYIHSGTKVFLPKIIYYFSKEMSLDMAGVLEMISECLPDAQKKAFRKCIKGRHDKCIHWLQQNSNFRYVIHENLASQRINF